MRAKITKTTVDKAVHPIQGQQITWDTELKGFGLRATPNRKTYVAQSRVNGSLRRVTLGTHGVLTPDQARQAAREALATMGRGVDIYAERERKEKYSVTLGEAFSAYMEGRKLSPNTRRDYDESMKNGFPDWKNKPVRAINRDMIGRRFDELSKVSQARTNLKFRFLRAVLNFAMEKYRTADGEPLIPSNPCNVLKALNRWHRIPMRNRYIAEANVDPLVRALRHSPADTRHRLTFKDFCAFLLLTGCREQEAARLSWKDINFVRGVVRIEITKNGDPHELPVGPWLRQLLQRRRRETKSLFVFPAENKTGHIKYHHKAVLDLCEETGIEFRLHDLRRTFATILNEEVAGEQSYFTIKRLLNHKMPSDITARYVQVSIEKLRQAMGLIEKRIVGTSPDLVSPDSRPLATLADSHIAGCQRARSAA